ncbi:hypothetical protein EIP91_001117 [Steccherinum ochraceum]|uniref:NmrA-like domain-containing protein n=1 Tax=Steccherinum ochraceum TaxID=92696 RepID=A0A4R0RRY1_9APHY|nr:hypothetical protein EIP91_001117 [Steccherinum ochraceum]
MDLKSESSTFNGWKLEDVLVGRDWAFQTKESTMSSTHQPIAIIGVTGNQGSSVLDSLLTTPHPIRALTGNPSKLSHYRQSTLHVQTTDITSPAQVNAGLKGVWALFVNTLSDYSKPEGTEEALLKSIIDSAVECGVQYLVLSALPAGMPARAYIAKSNAMEYAKQISEKSDLKPIFVQMGWYMSGFSGYMKPIVNPEDGVVEFRWSTIDDKTYFPLVSALTDLGPVVKAILENPEQWINVEIPVVGDVLTIPQVAEVYSRVTGQPARAVFLDHVPQEAIPQWISRHKGYKEAGYFPKYVGRETEISDLARKLNPQMKTFEQWLRDTDFDARN